MFLLAIFTILKCFFFFKSQNLNVESNRPKALLYQLNSGHMATDVRPKSFHYMFYHSLKIGKNEDHDLCLGKLEKHCKYVSNQHATIYFDKNTAQYELLNYSQYGTIVDNVYYGVDTGENGNFKSENMMPIEKSSSSACLSKCKCDTDGRDLTTICCEWEGSALLNHGSHIKFGCLEFVFCIIDYDSVL
jgi:pSer/pThr/pTyr-binding forkhead associated (FHA) protein